MVTNTKSVAEPAKKGFQLRYRKQKEPLLQYALPKMQMADENKKVALSTKRYSRLLQMTIKEAKKIQTYHIALPIATWNVRSLFMSGKLPNTQAQMTRMNIDIMKVCKIRWPGLGKQKTRDVTFIIQTEPIQNINIKIAQSITDFIPLSYKIPLLKLQTFHRNLHTKVLYCGSTLQ